MRQERREREDKTVGKRDIRSVERRGVGRGTRRIQDGHYRDLQEGKQGILRRWVWGWINGGRKDRGFGWAMIRDGGERLF